MVDTWDHFAEIPKFARLDSWVGVPLMVFGNMIILVTVNGYDYLFPFAFGIVFLGGLFLSGLRFPEYLIETYDDDEVIDARIVGLDSFAFRYGPVRGQLLSGPYFGDELEKLKQDTGHRPTLYEFYIKPRLRAFLSRWFK